MASISAQNILFLFIYALTRVHAVTNPLSLCSSDNTGDLSNGVFNIYNSYGSCTGHCSGFAFAILQGKNCWCSNVAPGSTTSVGDCSESCPGFDSDHCGNTQNGLYGYAQLSDPSSTMQASSSSTSSSSSSSSSSSGPATTTSSGSSSSTSSSQTPTSSSTTSSAESTSSSTTSSASSSTENSSSKTTSSTASSSSASSTEASSTSSSAASSAATSGPTSSSASSSRVTSPSSSTSASSSAGPTSASNSATPASSSASSPTDQSSSSSGTASPSNINGSANGSSKNADKGYWHEGGKVAGTFIGVGIGVLLIIALILFFICRRRRAQAAKAGALSINSGGSPRAGKTNSPKSPFGGGSRHVAHREGPHPFSPFGNGSFNSHARVHSQDSALDETDFVPIFDQRVDPTQMYMRWEKNGSNTSLQDHEDYSRKVLRVANPDDM